MATVKIKKQLRRKQRHKRVRAKVYGTANKPRLFVYKSNKHIYSGLADDERGAVLFSEFDANSKSPATVKSAQQVGKKIGERALKEGYKSVVFDKGGYKYHGKVKALADAARSSGLRF